MSNNQKRNNNNRSNSEDVEWNTPEWVITKIAEPVMGRIVLDPASNFEANSRVVKAKYVYTEFDDGLSQPWLAETVWVNPPYGSGNKTGKWWNKMWAEYQAGHFAEGMFLANSATETGWFQHALGHCPVLLFAGRLKFWKPDVDTQTGRMGSALVYLPPLDGPLEVTLGSPLTPPLYSPGLSPAAYSTALARFASVAGDYGAVIMAL